MSSKEIFLSQFEILSNYNLFISKKRQITTLKASYQPTLESLQKALKIATEEERQLGGFEDCGEFYQDLLKESKHDLENFEDSYARNLRNLISEKIKHEKSYKRLLHKHKELYSEESYNFIVSIIQEKRQHNIEQSHKRMQEVRETSHKNECLYKLITILFGKRLDNHIYLPSFQFKSKEYKALEPLFEAFNKKNDYPSKDKVLSLIEKYSSKDVILLYTQKILESLRLKEGKKSDNYIKVINEYVDVIFK